MMAMYTSIWNIENLELIGVAYLVCIGLIGLMVSSFVVAESASLEQTGNHTDCLFKNCETAQYMTDTYNVYLSNITRQHQSRMPVWIQIRHTASNKPFTYQLAPSIKYFSELSQYSKMNISCKTGLSRSITYFKNKQNFQLSQNDARQKSIIDIDHKSRC